MKIVFMVLLSVAVLPAQAAQWLPDPQRVAQAIGAQPEVQAARARVDAARAQARAHAAGPHEVTASAIVQQRNIDEAGGGRDYREYELQVGRALPGQGIFFSSWERAMRSIRLMIFMRIFISRTAGGAFSRSRIRQCCRISCRRACCRGLPL